MAFPAATYNLTVLGPAVLTLPHLQGNIKDLTPGVHRLRHETPITHITQIINATEEEHFHSLLQTLHGDAQRSPTLRNTHTNFRRRFGNRWRASNINKRSHQSKGSTTNHQAQASTTNANTIFPEREPNFRPTTQEQHSSITIEESAQSTTPHSGGHVSLMDTRSPEHADLFESNKVRGPIAVKTTVPTTQPTTTTTKSSTSSTTTSTTTERTTSSTTEIPQVVTPRMSLPSPSPGAMQQLPVLWTALSLALGVEVQGEIVRGLPCIKRLNQLFCRNAGTSYPSDLIESFIDNNKALTRRMYGDFQSDLGLGEIVESAIRSLRRGRSVDSHSQRHPVANMVASNFSEALANFGTTEAMHLWDDKDIVHEDDPTTLSRMKRQAGAVTGRRPSNVPTPPSSNINNSDRQDSCNSKMEIVTPYWASNSAGKILAIVNLKEFSQVIHQEVCTRSSTKRCNGECGCEQKYKWHRMLAYDLENECKGIFVDWFLFPSCCVCRCDP